MPTMKQSSSSASAVTLAVKAAVQSAEKCTSETTSSLSRLLLDTLPDGSISSKEGKEHGRTTSSTARRGRAGQTKAATKVTVHHTSAKNAALAHDEKVVLATEIFNLASKTLSECIKQFSDNADANAHRTSPTRTPLSVTSPNRQTAPPKTKSSKPASTRNEKERHPISSGVTELATCATIALAALRDLQLHGNESSVNSQLEQGVCVLAGKLLTLGLHEAAIAELHRLRGRILGYMDIQSGRRARKQQAKAVPDDNAPPSLDDLPELLQFDRLPASTELASLLILYQHQVSKAILAEKRPSYLPRLQHLLSIANPSSPANVILYAYKKGVLPQKKSIQQLQALSHTAVSLSLSTTRSEDGRSQGSKTQQHLAALDLQILSLEILALSWSIAGHKFDETKEIWEPLSRFLGSFTKRCTLRDQKSFEVLQRMYLRLRDTLKSNGYFLSSPSHCYSASTVLTTLGQKAQEAGCPDVALSYHEQALLAFVPEHQVSIATCRCRIAIASLDTLSSAPDGTLSGALKAVSEASKCLAGSLKGSQAEIDQLIIESARLKKGVLRLLQQSQRDSSPVFDGTTAQSFGPYAIEFLSNFVRLLSRYIGQPLSSTSRDSASPDPQSNDLFHQRVARFRDMALWTVDSVVTTGRLAVVGPKGASWSDVQAMLSDCSFILTCLQRHDAKGDQDTSLNKPLGFVRLSNVYWSRYLKLKETNQSQTELIHVIEQSISVLQKSPTFERLQGFLGYKFERLASLLFDAGEVKKANSAHRSSVEAYIEAGTLQDAAEDLNTMPVAKVFKDSNGSGFNLHRSLGHYVKHNWRKGNQGFVMDDASLSAEHRAALLESQLLTMMDMLVTRPVADHMQALSSMVHKLMELYPADKYPTRRARVCLQAVKFALNSSGRLDEGFFRAVIQESEGILTSGVSHASDAGLSPFRESIFSSLHFYCAICFGHLSRDNLQTVVQSWVTIANSSKSWEQFCSRVEEPDSWILQCRTVLDYLEVRGFWKLRLSALSSLTYVLEMANDRKTELVSCLTQLGLQYARLGRSRKAASALSRGQHHVQKGGVKPTVIVAWHLAFAENLVEEGDAEKAAQTLLLAKAIFEDHADDALKGSFQERTAWERLVADATAIHSMLCLQTGNMDDAIYFAKLCVKLNNRIWMRLDRFSGRERRRGMSTPDSTDAEVESLQDTLSRVNLDDCQASTLYRHGCLYWQHFTPHFSALVHLSKMSSHIGLFQDTIYFAEQALEVAKEIGATSSIVIAQALLGEQHTKAADSEKGKALLDLALQNSQNIDCTREVVAFYASLSRLQAMLDLEDEERQTFSLARKALSELSENAIEEPEYPVADSLGKRMSELTLKGKPDNKTSRSGRGGRSWKPTVTELDLMVLQEETVDVSLLRLQGDILRQEAKVCQAAEASMQVSTKLEEADRYPKLPADEVNQKLMQAESLISSAIDKLSLHAVYCVLSESTYSLPSVRDPSSGFNSGASSPRSRSVRGNASSTARRSKTTGNSGRGKTRTPAVAEYALLLSNAEKLLVDISGQVIQHGSTQDNHKISHLLSQVHILHSATNSSSDTLTNTSIFTSMTENGRNLALSREKASICADKRLGNDLEPLSWPSAKEVEAGDVDMLNDYNLACECAAALPQDWNVVSLSLSSDCNELIITKVRSAESPFVLRLPLKRSDSEDATEEEEEFGFEQGKAEIQELIQLANQSAHDARARGAGHAAKKEWWANRQQLDIRIKDFLKNVEMLWFGGFRGIFSQKPLNEKLLVTFCSAFDKIMDKHLPSRRQRGKQKQKKLSIDPNVLDLFVKLDTSDNDENPEDLVMDLLYFVVDILQFHGERNAYDEVDFDMMVVEVMDAVKAYKDAEDQEMIKKHGHTIIVLDKELHGFPWESMEFLRGQSISRVPSLSCVTARLAWMQERKTSLHREKVSYVLNPGGDLKSTQANFESLFSLMPGWTGITNRSPSETEFENALEDSDVFLYFGHGSGAQYIRGRTIRRLDKCAVSFLMGCSSGILTEANQFEPYGTPMNYMQAGAGALVATLWDVTDKDIDRFTKTALERWGLVSAPTGLPSVGLDTAISSARDSCIFKYLNGAAPVVYGIPVFLG